MPREIEEQDIERALDAMLSAETVSAPSFCVYDPAPSISAFGPVGYDDIRFQAGECNTSVKEIMNRICALEKAVSELKKGGFCL